MSEIRERMIIFAKSKATGNIVSIDDVENGFGCNCVCVKCCANLIARQGKTNEWHFAHEAGISDCDDPDKINETALHMLAEQLFKDGSGTGKIALPAYSISGTSDPDCDKDDWKQTQSYIVSEETTFNFEYAQTEAEKLVKTDFGNFKPDILLTNKQGEKLYVEIKVTHGVDAEKKRKIQSSGESCIEIDLSNFCEGGQGNQERIKKLKECLFDRIDNKEWINHRGVKEAYEELIERNQEYRRLQKEKAEREARERAERERAEREARERLQRQRIEKAERDAREARERAERERAKREARERAEREARERAEREFLEKFEREAREREQRQRIEKTEGEKERRHIKQEQCLPSIEDCINIEVKSILEQLNDEQLQPVLQTEGPVLVLAGAGSGKTRVLTSRIAYLVEEKGVPTDAILSITFTNKAANEMKERLGKIVDVSRMWVCTIHSMCVRILRMYPEEVGIQPNFSIYSEVERNNIIKKSFQECDFDDEKLLKNIKWHIANAKMLGFEPERYAEEYAGERDIDIIVKVYARYQKHLRENNALDFDDLLNETRNLLRKHKEVREYLGGRFRYILVDEFQDTNEVQYEVIKLLASVYGNLFVVGDDDQSIYGWRGAKIENILHFEKDFKGAHVFKLERNYRSTKNILKLANTVIRNNGKRKNKVLWTENEEGAPAKVHEADEESGEARFIAHTIAGLIRQGYSFSDFAILMRLNALTRSFEQEFTGDGIPYKVFGGFKFFERKEIKDLLAYLRLINNPFDSEAAVRIINFPKRGIGARTVEALQNYAFETELSVYDALIDVDEIGFNAGTRQKLVEFRDLIKTWIIDSQEMPVNELVKKIIEDTKMREAYADDSDESINKRANIDEFINSVEEYSRLNPEATLTDYLNQVTLSSDTDDMDDGNYVTLATVHSVKGLEFKCVFICGLEENILPVSRAVENDDDMEEERRLMYVAITRAKERLYLTRSKSRYLYGKREPTSRSRFLKELSSEIELPKEVRPMSRGYSDWDDPESYGNSAYGGGRYASNDDYGGRRNNFGGGYGGGYSSSFEKNSAPVRSKWTGNSYGSNSYGSASYGSSSGSTSYGSSSSYGSQSAQKKSSGFVYGGIGKAMKPATGGKDLSAFTVGAKVKHPKFGVGVIVSVNGVGNNMNLHIAFEEMGIKQLSASLAPLTVI